MIIMESKKIRYTPLDEDARKITQLVKSQRFRNSEAFMDRAVQVLLTWETDPKTSIDIIKGYPQTQQQKQTLEEWLQPHIYKENFAQNKERQESINENERMIKKIKSKNDHVYLLENLEKTRKFIKNLEIVQSQDGIIPYDQYPMLFRFYSRFAPAKIVLCVLSDLLRQDPSNNKINLKILRADALDIAAEFRDKIAHYENANDIKRTQKISTGFPKLTEDIEENVPVQKRFRDQYIGKTRRDRKDKHVYFEGILAALGFVTLTKEGKEEYVSLTEMGREFYLLENPILAGDYTRGLSVKEAEFILKKIIPKFKLEKMFYDAALRTVKKYHNDPRPHEELITKLLDQEIMKCRDKFVDLYPDEAKKFEFDRNRYGEDDLEKTVIDQQLDAKYVEGWRVATMGRLAELKQIQWKLKEGTGKSSFRLLDKK